MGNFITTNLSYPCVAAAAVGVITMAYFRKQQCRIVADEPFDEDLFKEPPPRDECDICMLTLPIAATEQKYQSCCGKVLCFGCIHAAYKADARMLCPFCRTPEATSGGEGIERLKKRADCNDATAISTLADLYHNGDMGLPQDYNKAMELYHHAGELGCALSYSKISYAYNNGEGVERDTKKAKHYAELAAMGGGATARHNLGILEKIAGNMERAVKHWMIAAGAGKDISLEDIRICFTNGHATKDDFEKALRAHKESKDAMKSDQRDAAAEFLAACAVARGQN